MNLLFSFNGRISRSQFWLGQVLIFALLFLGVMPLYFVYAEFEDPDLIIEMMLEDPWSTIWYLFALWPTSAIGVKRLKDLGRDYRLIAAYVGPLIALEISNFFTTPAQAEESSLFALLSIIVLLTGAVYYVWLGFFRGQPFDNAYGQAPSGIERASRPT